MNASIVELLIKALTQVCYNQTGLDETIQALKEANAANQPATVTPVPSADNPPAN